MLWHYTHINVRVDDQYWNAVCEVALVELENHSNVVRNCYENAIRIIFNL